MEDLHASALANERRRDSLANLFLPTCVNARQREATSDNRFAVK